MDEKFKEERSEVDAVVNQAEDAKIDEAERLVVDALPEV